MFELFSAVLPGLLATQIAAVEVISGAGLPDHLAWLVVLAGVGSLAALLTAPLRSLTLQRQRSRLAAQPLVQAAKSSGGRGRERRARVREVYTEFGTGPGAGELSRQALVLLTLLLAVLVAGSIGVLHSAAPWSGMAPELVDPVAGGQQRRQLPFAAGLLAAAVLLAGFVLARRAAATATAQPLIEGPLSFSAPLPGARPGLLPSALLGTAAALLGGALLLAFAVGHQLTAAALHWRICRHHRVDVPGGLLQRYAPEAIGRGGAAHPAPTAVLPGGAQPRTSGTAVLPLAGNTRAYERYDDDQGYDDAQEYDGGYGHSYDDRYGGETDGEPYARSEDDTAETAGPRTTAVEPTRHDRPEATRVLDLAAGVWRSSPPPAADGHAAVLTGLRREPQPLRPGDPSSIGEYQILARIGAGGMGSVYLAQREGTATRVALKAINPGLLDDGTMRLRFLREARTLEYVRGTYTARVLDYGVDGSMPFLVMEYLDGPTLAEYVTRRGAMREPALIEALALALAEAMAAIHGLSVTHRDLKPGNVVLTGAGPKVIDFGIAATVDQTQLTTVGSMVGTAAYSPPEVLHGHEATAQSDVWAWACCVAYAARGGDLFLGSTTMAVAHDVLNNAVRDRWQPALAGTSDALQQTLDAALRLDPLDRPADGNELLRRLAGTDGTGAAEIRTAVTQVWGRALDGRGA
ncbi:MAG: serine/threonine protein kinase [Actinomycetota bacterium]|nr:serine/threonine protein kinase [Actinomycetota bacterium]